MLDRCTSGVMNLIKLVKIAILWNEWAGSKTQLLIKSKWFNIIPFYFMDAYFEYIWTFLQRFIEIWIGLATIFSKNWLFIAGMTLLRKIPYKMKLALIEQNPLFFTNCII